MAGPLAVGTIPFCPAGRGALIASPLVPPKPTVDITITLPPCAKDTPPCVVVEWSIVPVTP